MDHCAVKKCKQPLEIIYLGKPVCGKHWDQLSGDRKKLRAALGLKDPSTSVPEMELSQMRSWNLGLKSSQMISESVKITGADASSADGKLKESVPARAGGRKKSKGKSNGYDPVPIQDSGSENNEAEVSGL